MSEETVNIKVATGIEQALLEHDWPGNVRDLRHTLERACIFSDGPTIHSDTLFAGSLDGSAGAPHACDPTLNEYLRSCEKRYIEHCLKAHGGRIAETAQALGISRKALWEKAKRLDIHHD